MPQDVTAMLVGAQQIEVGVNGPAPATRLYICTGLVPVFLATDGQQVRETFTFHIGPALNSASFVRAVATAGLSAVGAPPGATAAMPAPELIVMSADADWDDETNRVQARIEIQVQGAFLQARGIGYTVHILAAT